MAKIKILGKVKAADAKPRKTADEDGDEAMNVDYAIEAIESDVKTARQKFEHGSATQTLSALRDALTSTNDAIRYCNTWIRKGGK